MEQKSYTLDFYKVQVGAPNENPPTPKDVFDGMLGRERPFIYKGLRNSYELRDLRRVRHGYVGVLAKFQTDDLPHAAAPGRAERELGLERNEGLLQKAHFFFSTNGSILVYQRNRAGVGPAAFSDYLTQVSAHACACHPVLLPDAYDRLMSEGMHINAVEVTIARPSAGSLTHSAGQPNWADHVVGLLAGSGGHKLKFTIKNDRRAHGGSGFLRRSLINQIQNLTESFKVHTARIAYQNEDDEPGMIDLLRDRLSVEVSINKNGRYPNSSEMWSAAEQAWINSRSQLATVADDDA